MNITLSFINWVRSGGGGSSEPAVTLAAPTWSDTFTYTDGTRLVAGDPNVNTGLVNANPGNLGWDAITTAAANNARFNPIVFQNMVRIRTANAAAASVNIGPYLLAPPAVTQAGPVYGQITAPGSSGGNSPSIVVGAVDQTEYLSIELNQAAGVGGSFTVIRNAANTPTTVFSASAFSSKPRMGGTNGQFKPWDVTETLTLLSVADRAYVRRAPGFPLGAAAGTAHTALTGNRFGIGVRATRIERIDAGRVGSAGLFITVNETHRYWVPKKRASASDPITAGVGDETFTGTYVGTIPSKMQWALFNMGTGAVIKDWATVPTADFTAASGTWSARLRAIPPGLNGRGAYAVGFRPVNAANETDPAWQCVSRREFYVTLNVGVIGQSNAGKFMGDTVTGTAYPRVDGLMTYTKADPPSLVQGAYVPNPAFWEDTTSVGNGRCSYLFGDYLANLYNLPISFEALAIAARDAAVLGPIDVTTGLPSPSSDWSYIQTHHAFAGGAYDILYLSQGENAFTGTAANWLAQWRDVNIPAYRDPAMHGQPVGTVIPVLYAITGRFTGAPGASTDAQAQIVRSAQYQLVSEVSDCYLAHSYTGVEMIDSFHYVATNGEGYNEAARRIRLTYDEAFNAGAYDGRGPVATSVTRAAAVLTVTFDLNGATSLTTRDGRDQTLGGTATALTSWQVSADNFATTLTITSAEQVGNTVVITLASVPSGPVRVRNHFGLNPDLTNWVTGSYADGTFIGMMPLVNSLLSN